MNIVILISIIIAFFTLFWSLTYKFHRTSFKIVSWLIWTASILILAGSFFWVVVDGLNTHSTQAFGHNLEGMSNTMGTFAFLWGLAAIFIFFSKRLYQRIRKQNKNDEDIIRRTLLLAKNHHSLFGWVTIVAAFAHGFYFLFHAPTSLLEFYSGIGAWVALVLLAVSGMLMGRFIKAPRRAKIMRFSHIALSVGYLGAMVLHFRGSIFISALLFAGAFLSLGILWGFIRFSQAMKSHET